LPSPEHIGKTTIHTLKKDTAAWGRALTLIEELLRVTDLLDPIPFDQTRRDLMVVVPIYPNLDRRAPRFTDLLDPILFDHQYC